MASRVYWDTCLFIEVLQKTKVDRLDACQALVNKAKNGELVIVTSVWSIDEVNKLEELEKSTRILREAQSKMILEFFENPYIKVRQVDREIAELAHELTRTHSLTNGDAVHVATAAIGRVDVLYTYDGIKKKRGGLLQHNLKIGVPPLRIEKPPIPSAGPLFDTAQPEEEG
jgi:predicted nucleic acid-binding protein